MKSPDITPAQITAVVGWVVAQLVAYGILSTEYQQLAVSAGATLVALALKIADAHIRNGRAQVAAAKVHPTVMATQAITSGYAQAVPKVEVTLAPETKTKPRATGRKAAGKVTKVPKK